MSKSPLSTLVPSNLSTSDLASTLRDAAELVVDATTSSAKAISAALPVPELAASLPAVIPFVQAQRAHRRRSAFSAQFVIVGAVVACVCVALVLRNRAQRQSPEVVEA